MEGSSTPGQTFVGIAGRWLPAQLLLFVLLFNGSRGLWAPGEVRHVAGAMRPIALWLVRRIEPAACRLASGRQDAIDAACFRLLVNSKFAIAQLSPVGHDSRVTAALIEKQFPGGVDEIAFVDGRALWELHVYLSAQVYEFWLRRWPYEPIHTRPRFLSDIVSAGDSRKIRRTWSVPIRTPSLRGPCLRTGFTRPYSPALRLRISIVRCDWTAEHARSPQQMAKALRRFA